jgi:hypothetical protein
MVPLMVKPGDIISIVKEYYQEPPELVIKYKERHPRFVDVHYVMYVMYEEKSGKRRKDS